VIGGIMRQSRRRARHQSRLVITAPVAAPSPLALLLPVTVLSAGDAAAAPAAGCTASLIPTGQESSWVAVNPATGWPVSARSAAEAY
jgi:hypothetical protein